MNSVEDVEAFLDTQVYPHHTSDARKTLAFEAQDSFLLQHSAQVDEKQALTKKYTTYGEFPLASLHAILQRLNLGPEDVVLDVGSGSGRLVLGTALLFPHLKACYGVEVVPELHAMAIEARKKAETMEDKPEMSPCHLVQGNVETGEYIQGEEEGGNEGGNEERNNPLSKATVVFMYCTTWRSENGLHLARPLRDALLASVREDVTIITTDKRFAEEEEEEGGGEGGRCFKVVDSMTVSNPEVFESDVYFHKIEKRGG